MSAKQIFVSFFKIFGLDVKRYTPGSSDLSYLSVLLQKYRIDLVLDIGANVGQFHHELRLLGYTKDVISFEPLSEAYKILKNKEKGYNNWVVYERVAIGNLDGETIINISNNSVSSSILPIGEQHVAAAPFSAYVKNEEVKIKKIDTISTDFNWSGRNIFFKIDTQGFEYEVLLGAKKTLELVTFVQLELSTQELYKGQKSFFELCNYMKASGFSVFAIFREFLNSSTLEILQYNVIFINDAKR
jgi:FkbM family methyltransferase